MKRSWVWVALLLSLGINCGILATLLMQRWRQPAEAPPAALSAVESAAPEPARTSDQPVPPEPAAAVATPAAAVATPAPAARTTKAVAPRREPPLPEPAPPASTKLPEPEPAPMPPAPAEPTAGDAFEPEAPEVADQAAPDLAEPPGRGPRFEILADKLGLEGESRDRFVTLQRQAFEAMRRQRQRMIAARAALRLELIAAEPDRARMQAMVAESTAAQQELERILVNSLVESRALLDTKQQRLYMRFVEERLRPAATQVGPQRRPLRDRFPRRRIP